MKISKKMMLAQGEQAIEDRKIVDNANLDEMEIMPTLHIIGSLRFLQELCNDKGLSVHDITPEFIIDVIKN
jgi:hypothetical protein